jgi:hypothetical protein
MRLRPVTVNAKQQIHQRDSGLTRLIVVVAPDTVALG